MIVKSHVPLTGVSPQDGQSDFCGSHLGVVMPSSVIHMVDLGPTILIINASTTPLGYTSMSSSSTSTSVVAQVSTVSASTTSVGGFGGGGDVGGVGGGGGASGPRPPPPPANPILNTILQNMGQLQL